MYFLVIAAEDSHKQNHRQHWPECIMAQAPVSAEA